MQITVEYRGVLRSVFEWKNECVVDAPDSCTCQEALRLAGIEWGVTRLFGFAFVDGKKVDKDYVLKEGDRVKAFPKSFGG